MVERWIYWLEEIGQEHSDLVGKKCANLGEMTKMGLPVPGASVCQARLKKDSSGKQTQTRK